MFITCRKGFLFALLAALAFGIEPARGQLASGSPAWDEIRIMELQGEVEVSPAGAATWVLTQTNQVLRPFDRLRTGANSRVALRWSNQSVVPFGALTELEILPPHEPGAQPGLHLVRGVISFFHRDKPGRIRVITRGAVAGVEGTEFVLAVAGVDGSERTTLSVIDGRVEFSNEQASLLVTNLEQAIAEPGKAPARTAGFIANQVLQWCFHYPPVLDPADLPFAPGELAVLSDSLEAYRAGDLPAALAQYPAGRPYGSDTARVLHAALLRWGGGGVESEAALASISAPAPARPKRLAAALRLLVATVKRQPEAPIVNPQLATELMANSYYEQFLALPGFSLRAALENARRAASASPEFGVAWTRVAELEFSFGRTGEALEALNMGLVLAPRHGEALVLKGYLLAAQNRTREAIGWFDRALTVDAALGNAWLGRGLCRIRSGDVAGGREDLLLAAALEPQRAELRSYLGKAYGQAGDFQRASKELDLAKGLDPNDPTAWLYSALLNQEHNRINDAIRDLEKSADLNDNRSVYRSRLLLDQDRAVRSANLAAIYRDAGMASVALQEAARSVNYDYANYSAHHFLAESYHELGDPNLIRLRYETPAKNEYLLANLLAPPGAGPLSPVVSQREYSRLFERDRFGVVSHTEYLSRGAWTQSGAQYGTFRDSSYNLEAFYRWDPGQRVNDDLEQRWLSASYKQQVTPQDSGYVEIQHYKTTTGDLRRLYDPGAASPGFGLKEKQEPNVLLGYHHEWSPGVHTLLLGARFDDSASLTNPVQATLVAFRPDTDPVTMPGVTELTSVHGITMQQNYTSKLEVYSAELQQIWQQPTHNTVVGVRFQYGDLQTFSRQTNPSDDGTVFDPTTDPARQNIGSIFRRVSLYGYHYWRVLDALQLLGGLTCDWLTLPENFRYAPLSDREETLNQLSPKAGFIWTPDRDTTVRFACARSLSGASLEQSCQLEPSQVAGFVQSYRSIIPESVTGPNAGARIDTAGLSLEREFVTGTYFSVSGEISASRVRRTVGAFDVLPDQFEWAVPSGLREHLDYEERSLEFSASQLLGQRWSCGAGYRLSEAVLDDDFVVVPDGLFFSDFQPRQRLKGVLHQARLFAIYNHPKGWFAQGEGLWLAQDNQAGLANVPGDEFWQFNAYLGYRLPRRRAEIMVGLLNITGEDYRLHPLNVCTELPRERTLLVRLQLYF